MFDFMGPILLLTHCVCVKRMNLECKKKTPNKLCPRNAGLSYF